jgi:hypothetical protein
MIAVTRTIARRPLPVGWRNPMIFRKTVLTLALVSLATSAGAVKRPNSLTLTCKQAINTVNQNKVVIMYTGRHIYERVLSKYGDCRNGEYLEWYYTKTKDKKKCRVGYYCRERDDMFFSR